MIRWEFALFTFHARTKLKRKIAKRSGAGDKKMARKRRNVGACVAGFFINIGTIVVLIVTVTTLPINCLLFQDIRLLLSVVLFSYKVNNLKHSDR